MFRNLLLFVSLFSLPFFSFAKSGVSSQPSEVHNLSPHQVPPDRCTDEDKKEHTSFIQQPAIGITQGCRTNGNLLLYVLKPDAALPAATGFLTCRTGNGSFFSSSYLFAIYPSHNFW